MRNLRWSLFRILVTGIFFLFPATALGLGGPPPPISQAPPSEPMILPFPGSSATEGEATEGKSTAAASEVIPPWQKPGPIPFNGGYIQHRPHVFVTFWGSEWTEYPGVKEKILDLYRYISGSSYQKIMTQYFDHSGYLGPETDLSSYTDTRVKAPPVLNTVTTQEEAQYSINHQPGWSPVSLDNQYIVITPPGTTQGPEVCAAHGWSGSFSWTMLPWSPASCQRGLGIWGSMQVSASHEWAESATDPIPVPDYYGWTNEDFGGELTDICNDGTPNEYAEATPGIYVAKQLDDYEWARFGFPGRCVVADSSPARFTVSTGSPSIGVHTATLNGSINPAGWPAYFNFAFSGPSGTQYLPNARLLNPGAWYGFSPAGQGTSDTPVSVEVTGLKGETTYQVRLDGNGAITYPVSASEGGGLQVMEGNTVQFTTPSWKPIVTTQPATVVKGHSAVLHGTVNPEGSQTTYQFEYGTTTGYGTSVPVPVASAGSGISALPAEYALSNLEEATVYHYRTKATNEEGTSYGTDQVFRTPGKPVIIGNETRYTGTFEPKLGASISPNGAATTYQVEYGTTTAYGSKAPATSAPIGSGLPSLSVGEYVGPLKAGTTYHFRTVAENEVGTTYSNDTTFATPPQCAAGAGKCAWSAQTTVDPPPFTEDEFKGIGCPSTTLCFAVGHNGYAKNSFLERWNGSSWALQQDLAGEARQVTCPLTTACVAVGVGESGAAQSWMINQIGGGGWSVSQVAPPLPSGSTQTALSGVSCTSTACTAVGSYRDSGGTYRPLVERWNGSAWSLQEAPNPPEGNGQSAMLAVSCPASTFCITGGEAQSRPVSYIWNGATWSAGWAPLPSGATQGKLTSVSCTSTTACTLVGVSSEKIGTEKPLAERWNGSGLSIQSSPSPAEAQGFVNFSGVSCAGSSSCTAVGYYASKVEAGQPVEVKTLAESWNGASWSIKTTTNSPASKYSALTGVSCPSTTVCTAVGLGEPGPAGEAEVTLAEGWNGTAWSTQTTVNPAPLTEDELKDVSCIGSNLCIAVGWNGYAKNSYIERWNGSAWSLMQNLEGEVKGVSCPFTNLCTAVGVSSSGIAQSWILSQVTENGWSVSSTPPPVPAGATNTNLKDVSCNSTTCTAVGSYRDSGGTYRPLVERSTGAGWFLQEAPNPVEGTAQNSMLSVSCSGIGLCTAVGEAAGKPVAETWNGTAWSRSSLPALPSGATLGKFASVSCPAADSCFAAGYSAEKVGAEKPLVETWNGTAWSLVTVPKPAEAQGFVSLNSINCLSPRACFAAGSYASQMEAGNPAEIKPLIESLSATQWSLQTPAPVAGFKFSGLTGISCTSVVACTTVGAKSTALKGQPTLTLAERYG